MSSKRLLPTQTTLEMLSPSSIAAYATRYALRVQPFLCLCKETSNPYKQFVLDIHDSLNAIISGPEAESASLNADELLSYALQIPEDEVTPKTKTAAISSAHAFKSTAYIANDFLTEGFDSAVKAIENANLIICEMNCPMAPALIDFEFLKELRHGDPINYFFDCGDSGPLGELWHGNTPDWFLDAQKIYAKNIALWKKEVLQ
ncbi:hypothetical protein [Gimesia panareensis]|uniref:hypothetical protein n=1 Tax=Gimesia panareensis TaxID=2527978 RepID=UPI001188810D|nr:hypothetical protein [Gimesia panareensis]QDU52136.1 hypothetical protein Pan110_45080 [Gimesia panareensis]